MISNQTIEHEWRVKPDFETWEKLLIRAGKLSNVVQKTARVCDIVLGRHGFDSVSKDGFVVRLRGTTDCKLELKERIEEGVWRETTVGIDSRKAGLQILLCLGFKPHLVIDRTRHTFESQKYTLCFDDVEGLGKFIEVETNEYHSESDDLEDIVKYLDTFPKLPPYGDLVRTNLQDETFAKNFTAFLEEKLNGL